MSETDERRLGKALGRIMAMQPSEACDDEIIRGWQQEQAQAAAEELVLLLREMSQRTNL